jgi:hypothetical protein
MAAIAAFPAALLAARLVPIVEPATAVPLHLRETCHYLTILRGTVFLSDLTMDLKQARLTAKR